MALQQTLQRWLRWPAFLLSLFVLYWSVAFASLSYHIRFLHLSTRARGDVFGWALGMKRIFGTRVLKVGTPTLYRKDVMYLINHRSWGDFLVDQYLTEGRSTFLARAMVPIVFPFFMTVIIFMKATMKFNRWIDKEFAATPQTAIAIYPEGHRSTMTESLPLKRGMLHYAYSRNMPVQVIIAANKEAILSEKYYTARWGQTVLAGYSEPVFPEKFETFDDFMQVVQATWDKVWKDVFTAKAKDLPELVCEDPKLDTPMSIRRNVSLSIIVVDLCFLALLYYSLHAARWTMSLLGPLAAPLLALFLLYVSTSLFLHSRPFDAVAEDARKHKAKLARASTADVLPSPPQLAASGVADVAAAAINEEPAEEKKTL